MKIEDQVANIEPAKEMKELGSKQDAYFSYFQVDEWNVVLRETREMFNPNSYSTINKDTFICSAPTVAELGEMLKNRLVSYYVDHDGSVYHVTTFGKAIMFIDSKEADARAKMWIYLKKEGLI